MNVMLWALLVAVTVFLLSWLGIVLQREADYIASLWPANAVAMALLLLRPKEDWWVGIGGCLLGSIALNLIIGNGFLVSGGYTLLNVLEIAAGVLLVSRRIGVPVDFTQIRNTACFLLCLSIGLPAVSAFPGAALGSYFYGADFWAAWRTWWVADSISIAIFGPLVLTAGPALRDMWTHQHKALEVTAIVLVAMLVTFVTFRSNLFPIIYLTFPFLVFAGVRHGIFAMGLTAAATAIVSIWLTINGLAWVEQNNSDLRTAILEVQIFIGVTLFASLAIATVMQENRAALANLARSEIRFRDLVEQASDAIFVHDLEGRFLDVNHQACLSLGYSRDELLSRSVADVEVGLATPDLKPVWDGLGDGGAVAVDGLHRRKDGTTFPVEVRLGALSYDDRPVVVAMARDVSERRLTEERLRVAKEAAEDASRAKSIFLANTSHELRTPLNAIIGYSELLEEEAESNGHDGYASDLQRIKAAGRHLLEIITGILDLSKVEAGRMDIEIRKFNVVELLDEVAASVAPTARENGNTVTVECDRDLRTVWSDQTKLRQILLNLVSNAAKFTRDGRIVLQARSDGADGIEFIVEDTGIGIPREHFPSLFDAFTQVDGSATREFAGTGLGLAITRRFCELLGGEIGVESTPGVGTTFRVRLPMRMSVAA